MKLRHALVLALSTTALMFASATAFAQAEAGDAPRPDDRIDRIEKQLREVREIVLQARSTGQPVEIKEAGPDPQVTALSAKFDDMGQTLQSLNGEVETLTHDDEQAHKDADAARDEVKALADRVDKLEKAVASLATAPPPPPASADNTAPAADASAPPGGGDPKVAYASAYKLMTDGDYPAAMGAYQDYLDHYPKDASAAHARYWLGEIKYVQADYAGAAVAYIAAMRGWPQTDWGADAAVKLSMSMLALNKPVQACAALSDFSRHYVRANAAEKARAAAARIKAKCGG